MTPEKPTRERLKRLQTAERRQATKTREMNIGRKIRGLPPLKIEKVCVEALLMLQGYRCHKCKSPLDFESKWEPKNPPPHYPVVAHPFARGSGGDHVVGSVWIWCQYCNSADAPEETSQTATQKKFGAILTTPRQKTPNTKKHSPWKSEFVPTPAKQLND